jgi:hypothetical protein
MSENDKDKIETQTGLKSSESSDPVLDEENNNQKSDSPKNNQEEAGSDPLNTAAEAPGDSDDDQTVAEAPEKGKDIDDDLSAANKSDPAEESKESQSSEEDSDHKGEDDNLTKVESDDTLTSGASETSSQDEDPDSAEEKQDDTANDDASKDQFEQQPNDAEEETEVLPGLEGEIKPKKKIPRVKAALRVIMVAAVFSGFFIFDNKSKTKSKEVENAVASKAGQKKTKPTIQPDDPNYIYYAKIDEISTLRETLLHKKEEILELKKHYQEGIEELENEILDELRRPDIVPFLQDIENKRI